MPQAAKQALPFVEEDGLFVSMQNGICTDAMAEVVGQERTVGSVIGFGASMLGPGELEMTSQGEFILGMPDGSVPEMLRELQKALDHVVPTQITEHLLSELYSKLIVNSCITSPVSYTHLISCCMESSDHSESHSYSTIAINYNSNSS